jgi:NAD+ kinase
MKNFLVVFPPDNEQAKALAKKVKEFLRLKETISCVFEGEYEKGANSAIDCVLSVGGDGSFLYAAHLAIENNCPILGINLGYFGYLTEVPKDSFEQSLDKLINGSYWVEKRSGVKVDINSKDYLETSYVAINEVAIERSKAGQTVKVRLDINDSALSSFSADGIIVATPTGSTAYNLSVGGPIVDPELVALIITPISAHSLINRSFVVGARSFVKLNIEGNRGAELVIDGQSNLILQPGTTVTLKVLRDALQMIHLDQYNFWQLLTAKFKLGNA